MSKYCLRFIVFLVGIFSLMIAVSVNAQSDQPTVTTTVVEERPATITGVPAPKAVVETPSGYYSCATVEAGWYHDVWYPAHKVCSYENSSNTSYEGVVWVDGYWSCSKATSEGTCTSWNWKAGHWEKTFTFY